MNPLAMIDMKSKLKGNTESYKNTNTYTIDTNKLGRSHEELIRGIIHGEKKAVEERTINTVISLDEAVSNIKKGR